MSSQDSYDMHSSLKGRVHIIKLVTAYYIYGLRLSEITGRYFTISFTAVK